MSGLLGMLRGSMGASSVPPEKVYKVLVIVSKNQEFDWYAAFAEASTAKVGFVAEQATWTEVNMCSYADPYADSRPLVVDINPSSKPLESAPQQHKRRTFIPDFVLVRSECRGVLPTQDYRNKLFAIQHAGIPTLNSVEALYCMLERPWVHGELNKLRRQHGLEKFPVISQTFYPDHEEMLITPGYPLVLKVGYAHAGYGKVLVQNHHQFEDLRSLLTTVGKYATAETFVTGLFDVRVQVIGSHIRAFRRLGMAGQWKTNTGTSDVKEIEVNPRFKEWASIARSAFGGLDFFTVDAIATWKKSKEAKEKKEALPEDDDIKPLEFYDAFSDDKYEYHILEINGSSSGMLPDRVYEDSMHLRDLVIEKLLKK